MSQKITITFWYDQISDMPFVASAGVYGKAQDHGECHGRSMLSYEDAEKELMKAINGFLDRPEDKEITIE